MILCLQVPFKTAGIGCVVKVIPREIEEWRPPIYEPGAKYLNN